MKQWRQCWSLCGLSEAQDSAIQLFLIQNDVSFEYELEIQSVLDVSQ